MQREEVKPKKRSASQYASIEIGLEEFVSSSVPLLADARVALELIEDVENKRQKLREEVTAWQGHLHQRRSLKARRTTAATFISLSSSIQDLRNLNDMNVAVAQQAYDAYDAAIKELDMRIRVLDATIDVSDFRDEAKHATRTSRPASREPRYCLCKGVASGDMICCDHPDCPIEWYHFGCLEPGFVAPNGRWYCPMCRHIICMVPELINGEEYLWTGHSSGELCLWSEMGRLVGKPFQVAKTGLTALCLVRPHMLWVGGVSGNIRVIRLDTNKSPFEICFFTTVAPGLEPAVRTLTNRTWLRPMRSGPSHIGSIENIPEDIAVAMTAGSTPTSGNFAQRVRERAHGALQRNSRAHSSHVRFIFAMRGRVYTAGGRIFSSIKVWAELDHHLEDVYMLQSKGPCSSMVSIPWQAGGNSSRGTRSSDWRLLTAHDSGLVYLWDPDQKPFRPLLEVETRKSPIRSLVVFEKLGVMCTAHKDGSVLVGRVLSHQMRIHGLTASTADDEDQIYPFVPRTLCEEVFVGGIQCAVAGQDSLFVISNRGPILYWPREKLISHFNILKRSSSRRMPVQVVNESVMVIDRSKVVLGETIYDGDFARVKRGRFLAKDVIVKEAKDISSSRRAMDALVKDAHILSTIRHPNIVNIMAVCDDPPFVVMQYYEEGSLYDVLRRCRKDERVAQRFSWMKRLTVAIDICCGMIFLHSQNPPILHRDLKSPNVFIEKDFTGASVGDFNLSKDTAPTHMSGATRPNNPMWLAPEVAKGFADFSVGTDIYAFGILLWEIATTRTPWDHLKTGTGSGRELFFGRIRYELFHNQRPELDKNENSELNNISGGPFPQIDSYVALMKDCWATNPEDRPVSFENVVNRLENIKKQLQDWRASHPKLVRQSIGPKKPSTPREEAAINPATSEPGGGVINNNAMEPKLPMPQLDVMPQSPFDPQSGEHETGFQGDMSGELPVSPFN